jgi:UrcA family protein
MSAPVLAQAQDPGVTNQVTVTVPGLRGPMAGSHFGRVQEASLSANVAYGDLNLRTRSGVRALRVRIADAADGMCARLEFRYPVGEPDRASCTRIAMREALRQVRAARGQADL